MKKAVSIALVLVTVLFMVYPLAGEARGGHWGPRGGYRGWWAPGAAIVGGAVIVAPYYGRYYGPYYRPYYDPYYVSPPVIIQEQTPVYVEPAPTAPSTGPLTAVDKMFIYPRSGQDEKRQATDRYECHRWAFDQTGYDPTKQPAPLTQDQQVQKQADYQRAITACLDGRGYTVK